MSNPRQSQRPVGNQGDEFRLVTLGTCRLEGPVSDLPGGLASGRPLAILAYLSLHGRRSISRDQLADLLWPDRDLKAARRVLRQALYVIRKGLGDSTLSAQGDLVAFSGGIRVDAVEFEAAVREGALEKALELYRGPFLEGFDLASDGDFGIWVDGERARLKRMFQEVVLRLVDAESAHGDWPRALEILDRATQAGGGGLPVLIKRIEMLELTERHVEAAAEAAALGQNPACPDPLPDWAQEVVDRVTQREHDPELVTDNDGPGPARPLFVGRDEEFQALMAQWRQAKTCQGKVALVVGDPGIGKSRLIEELLRVARLEDATVLTGKSYELEDGLLFGALVDVMAQALKAPGFAAVSDVWLTELTRLLPELMETYPQLQVGGDVETAPGRRRFHEAVAQVLEALAFEAPVVCVLDDLHWADEATLELVHYLVRRLCASQVLIVVGLRPREASESLRRLQHVLEAEHGGVRIELSPLERPAVDMILRSMGHGTAPPDTVAETVWAAAGGNPFLVISTVTALWEMDLVAVDEEGWRLVGDGPAGELPQPWVLVRSRVEDLPARTHEILELAAIAGRSFDARLLAEASGEDPDSALVHLEALADRKILKMGRANGHTTFDFAHDRLRQAVYEGIPPERLSELHLRAARGLAGSSGLSACILARHLHEAGQTEEAYRQALAGAEWARGVFAYAGEVEMLDLALENAPGEEERNAVRQRLNQLTRRGRSEAPTGQGRAVGGHRLRTVAAATAVMVTLGAGWLGFQGVKHVITVPPLPPLPEGVLVWMQQGDSGALAVVDPDEPRRRPQLLTDAEMNLPSHTIHSSVVLSPDLERVAFTIDDGNAPDVWVQRRDGRDLRRFTTDPEDDIVTDWLPDGSGLLVVTYRNGLRPDYGRSLLVSYFDGSPDEVISVGPTSENWASVSPDGSKLLVVRRLDGYSIWVMDRDGTDPRMLVGPGELETVGTVAWSPNGRRAAFTDSRAGERTITVFDLADPLASRHSVVAPGSGAFAWSADGTRIFYSSQVDGNSEVFAVSVDRMSDAVRLTYTPENESVLATIGPAPAYAASVEVVGPAGGRLPLLVGDTVTLTSVAWSSNGNLLDDAQPEFVCSDPAVCSVDSAGVLWAHRVGKTLLVADLGGWRADTIQVRIGSGAAELLFREDWNGGLDPGLWNAVGDPAPKVVDGGGTDGSRGLIANGDAKYSSGVSSVTGFPWIDGIAVEVRGRGAFDFPEWPSFHALAIGLSFQRHPPSPGDQSMAVPVKMTVGRDAPLAQPRISFPGSPLVDTEQWDYTGWHEYGVQFLPNGQCQAWMDGELVAEHECPLPPTDSVWVVLDGRASHEPVIHDDVKVWRGVRWR